MVAARRGAAMKRLLLLASALAALVFPVAASAHPLGNFTVNRFSRVEVADSHLYVRYVLDLAEIPTFQAGRIDAGPFARSIARRAELSVNGRRVPLVPTDWVLAHPRGAAGLKTTRFQAILRGPKLLARSVVVYHDRNYADRVGWKEVLVGDTPSRSHELRAYPQGLLSTPLGVTSVRAPLGPEDGSNVPPRLTRGDALRAPDRIADGAFASLVSRDDLGFWVILTSLAAAVFWGAAHALSPGHGKTIVAAYLVGRRGTARHAALLGLIVTVTHTIGVFAFGLVTLLLSHYVVPDELYPWVNLVSGILVVAIGLSVLHARVRRDRGHSHHHHHGEAPSSRSLLAVGVSGGLLPCPSALVVLLAAISLHRIGFGLVLVVAFSAGLALTITGIGLAAVLTRSACARVPFEGRVLSLVPALSAVVIVAAGIGMTVRAV
jgi:nickel/cobalt exporter